MATMKIVPQKDWEILREYLSDPAVVLVPEELLEKLPEDQASFLRECDGGDTDYLRASDDDDNGYNFGGEADTWIDKVTSPNHLFISYVFPDEAES